MREAQLYTPLEGQKVRCRLCAHRCEIPQGQYGFCRVRQNIGGVLYTRNYGNLVAAHADPVEKKPLYHFLPGSLAFSIACAGCNFRCGFCQNWEISQAGASSGENGILSAEKVVEAALRESCRSIAYTYTEPTIFFEFMLETAKLARAAGLRNIFVSNGYLTEEAASLLIPYIDAANIDLKFFKEESYRKICAAKRDPVLDTIRILKKSGIWVEVTTLVIPGVNDAPEELGEIAGFISSSGKDIPWHVSAFHPEYRFEEYPSTPESSLKVAYDLGRGHGLLYVYPGNAGSWGQDTLCGACGKSLIKRRGFDLLEFNLSGGKCGFCGAVLPGVFC
ncbi:MAG: AmmeMemoRadiSam system radical SAM enzyme [Candidatus Omnitrophica bacterium]|jgi:pyruvate formate lyase activating enzyme|nr:AmmeMemoRadiSam system radical SAM enzyme [Candidatus Omnitrophota bacterium]MDD3274568.1 AmmeMemoRadiSam system radical SAM enzyme [Candidatus Omnitrophota bacterium]MDD5078022.1 AmmeMemoRadiSam system radical SAM enzyme [Candidatus Omnitrophota bacterium]MDD5724593.1 AmmeMemoRadiSam system radical SAM enzyme [Candidatus Omnitrophota bacterium]